MKQTKENIFNISLSDTSVMKGIAIIAMLCHHVFETGYPPLYSIIGIIGKVCVSIFLFCSGYGLAVQFDKAIKEFTDIKQKVKFSIKFIIKRLIKFYSAYWFVFVIFVPLGIFVFDRSLIDAYGETNIFTAFIVDFLGLQGYNSYNITWWFNKLIIIFYFLFPILFYFCERTKWIGLVISFLLMRFATKLNIFNYYDLLLWQSPFLIGIYYKLYKNTFNRLSTLICKYPKITLISILFIFVLCVIFRVVDIPLIHLSGIRMDSYLTVSILLIVLLLIGKTSFFYKMLSFCGKHSMNIYFIHTFFNSYCSFTHNYLHNTWMRIGGGNIIVLLMLCLVISIMIEWIKDKIYWNKISTIIVNKIN